MANSITTLALFQHHSPARSSPGSDNVLVCDDLRPIMAFKCLRRLDFNLNWNVELSDDDLMELASAWHHLEIFLINREWGWRQTSHGITPDGIVRLLQTSQVTESTCPRRGRAKLR
ncbi:hypothetical protein JVU11DRAFT_2272 [Chiua virens]|nr:hypothetical protein JVU11DRAFT_2272 [Chiua virens]